MYKARPFLYGRVWGEGVFQLNPTFEESLQKFQKFLENNWYPREVVWVTPDDVLIGNGPTVYVKTPIPAKSKMLARQLFEIGIAQQNGVLFDTLCQSDGMTFCYAWVPASNEEADRSLMSNGLKLAARTGSSKLPARIVPSRFTGSTFGSDIGDYNEGKQSSFMNSGAAPPFAIFEG